MTTQSISDFDSITTLAGTDVLLVDDISEGTTNKITISKLQQSQVVLSPLVYTGYLDLNNKNLHQGIFGDIHTLSAADTLANGDSPTFTMGIGFIMFSIIAGSDFAGTLTVTGNTIDPDDATETVGDIEDIIIDALTTDTSDTDAEGNERHGLSGAYITSKIFKGDITVSTSDLNISDLDIYYIEFENCNEASIIQLDAIRVMGGALNSSAFLYGYLYSVTVTSATKKVDIVREVSIEIPSSDITADKEYRMRKTISTSNLDGSKDGFLIEMFLGRDANQDWEHLNWILHVSVPHTVV